MKNVSLFSNLPGVLFLSSAFVLLFALTAAGASLHEASASGDAAQVKQLIASGANVNVQNKNGLTPLHLAALNGRHQVAELLIAGGADINARDKSGATPLILAAKRGDRVFAETLIGKGKAIVGRKGTSAAPPTSYALATRIPDSNGLCVKENKANLRAGPGLSYKKLWQVYLHTPFVQIGKSGDWYRVKDFEGDVYWVFNSLVTDAYMCAIVKTGKANIRTGPATEHPQAPWSPVNKFYTLKVLQVSGKWVKVDNGVGEIGWIHRPLIWIQ